MFEDFEKISSLGTITIGRTRKTTSKFFCFWQPGNSFDFTKGLLADFELSEYGYVASAIEESECIPFGSGNTPEEAYNKMKTIFDKYFDVNGNWINTEYTYYNFISDASEIEGYIDFISTKEDNFKFFGLIKEYKKGYDEYVEVILEKYNETGSIKKVEEYIADDLDWFINTSIIEKILKYNTSKNKQ